MTGETNRILIIGGTGHLGKYMVKASVSLGHPTYAYVRPIKPTSDPSNSKLQSHKEFEAMGVTLFKRFFPSEFGNEEDRVSGLPPFEAIHVNRRLIRRATEAAGITYTYVSANTFSTYFVNYLLHPGEKCDEIIVYGSGEAKAVLNYEEDIAAFTLRAATDPRAANRIVICRPHGNIVSQMELISSWEKKTGCPLKKIHVPEEEIIELSKSLPHPDNVRVSIIHSIFIKGEQMNFELTENYLEATKLYPDYKYTSIHKYLDICLVNPPKIKLAEL